MKLGGQHSVTRSYHYNFLAKIRVSRPDRKTGYGEDLLSTRLKSLINW
jgi:hypothetical protein